MSYGYPGVVHEHPTGTEDYSIRGKFIVPANLHIGNMGLAPKYRQVCGMPDRFTGLLQRMNVYSPVYGITTSMCCRAADRLVLLEV